MSTESLAVAVVRWTARLLALTLLLFWGWFFVGQIEEWVIQLLPQTPLLTVWIAQTLYLLMMAGLVIGLRWELVGGALVIGTSVPLFLNSEPLFIPLAVLPGVLYIICWLGGRAPRRQLAVRGDDCPALTSLNAA